MTQPAIDGLELLGHLPSVRVHTPPLLFVHGAFAGAWCWEEHFLPWFAAHGFAAHALSLRGHGASHGGEALQSLAIADYVEDIATAVDRLAAAPVLIGHSMGGFVVQKYLETHEVPAAALLAPVPPNGLLGPSASLAMWEPGLFWEIGKSRSNGGPWGSVETMRRALLPDDVPAAVAAPYLARMNGESLTAMMDMSGGDLVDIRRVGPVPLLLLGGAEDRLIPPAYIRSAARAYGVEADILPGIAHGMMLGPGWETVARRLHDWLIGLGL